MNNKLRDKLYSHPTPVDTDDLWNGMQKKKKKRVLPFILFGLLAITLSLYFTFYNGHDDVKIKSNDITTSNSSITTSTNNILANNKLEKDTELNGDYLNEQSEVTKVAQLKSNTKSNIKSYTQHIEKNQSGKFESKVMKTNSFKNIMAADNRTDENKIITTDQTTPNSPIQKSIKSHTTNLLHNSISQSENPKTIAVEKSKEVERGIYVINEVSTLKLNPLFDFTYIDIEQKFIAPLKNTKSHSITINIGTLITQNDFESHTKPLPGINANLSYSKYIGRNLKVGMGINYIQHREHLTTVYKYSEVRQENIPTTEIYNQDGSIQTLTSLVSVIDNFERSVSKVNKKQRIDFSLLSEYCLFTIGRLSTIVSSQLNYKISAWNEGLELREDFDGLYDINNDENNIINQNNNLSYSYGIGICYALTEHFDIGLRARRFKSASSFYTDESLKYQGYNGGISIEYKW